MTPQTTLLESEQVLRILKEIESNPHITQRYLAEKFGVSLGKINFLLRAFIDKGLIKVSNFKKSNNKMGYVYALTLEGIQQRIALTQKFLHLKLEEYTELKKELESMSESYIKK